MFFILILKEAIGFEDVKLHYFLNLVFEQNVRRLRGIFIIVILLIDKNFTKSTDIHKFYIRLYLIQKV